MTRLICFDVASFLNFFTIDVLIEPFHVMIDYIEDIAQVVNLYEIY